MGVPLFVAALGVAGLASYLHLSEWSTESVRGAQGSLGRQILARMR
jgi:hypothetical protein